MKPVLTFLAGTLVGAFVIATSRSFTEQLEERAKLAALARLEETSERIETT